VVSRLKNKKHISRRRTIWEEEGDQWEGRVRTRKSDRVRTRKSDRGWTRKSDRGWTGPMYIIHVWKCHDEAH
jgi:hypothetical protein